MREGEIRSDKAESARDDKYIVERERPVKRQINKMKQTAERRGPGNNGRQERHQEVCGRATRNTRIGTKPRRRAHPLSTDELGDRGRTPKKTAKGQQRKNTEKPQKTSGRRGGRIKEAKKQAAQERRTKKEDNNREKQGTRKRRGEGREKATQAQQEAMRGQRRTPTANGGRKGQGAGTECTGTKQHRKPKDGQKGDAGNDSGLRKTPDKGAT